MGYRPGKPFIVNIQGTAQWLFAQDPETGEWFGVSPALNLNASGDTFAELQQCVVEAMQLLFLDLFRDGELEAFARSLGWKISGSLPDPDSNPRFDAPYNYRLTKVRELMPA